MPDLPPEWHRLNEETIRPAKAIKERLLKEAWHGHSSRAAADLIQDINARVNRVNEMPEGHEDALANIIPNLPKSIMRLNARAYRNGEPTRYLNTAKSQLFKPETQTLN